jgi:hypothetical protein
MAHPTCDPNTLVLRQVSNDGKRINPKHEIRNSKQIQMTKIQMTKTKTIPTHRIAFVLNFELWNFGFVSDFDIRISNLLSQSDNRDLTQHYLCPAMISHLPV